MIRSIILGLENLAYYELVCLFYKIIYENQLMATLEKECLENSSGTFPILIINEQEFSKGLVPEEGEIIEKIEYLLKDIFY